MKELTKLSIKLMLRKKTTIFNIAFFSIVILVIVVLNAYSATAINYMKNDIYNSIYYKSLTIGPKEEDNIEELKKTIKSIDHVSLVIEQYAYNMLMDSEEFKNEKFDGEVFFNVANNQSLPKIVKGTNFPDEEGNYLVCPTNFYPTSNPDSLRKISSKYSINTNQYLNKEIDFSYMNREDTKKFNEKYKIVGLYNADSYLDVGVCYTTENALKKIAINRFDGEIDLTTNKPMILNQREIYVQVDNVKNIQSVENELSKLDISNKRSAFVIEEYFINIKNNISLISNIILVLTFFIFFILTYKQFSDDITSYKILRYLGYKRNNIYQFLIISNIFQFILGILVSAIICGIFYLGFSIVLNLYPFILNNWKICLDYKSLSYVIGVIIIFMTFGIGLSIMNIKSDKND